MQNTVRDYKDQIRMDSKNISIANEIYYSEIYTIEDKFMILN